jgi:hypothetical protein
MQLPPHSLRHPFRIIRHIPGQPISYLNNPKVGCTSIALTMWRVHNPTNVPRIPHRHDERPFIRNFLDFPESASASLLQSRFFTVVRNPFARTLSAYLNKVGLGKKPWIRISATMGLSPDVHPSLEDLLQAMIDSNPFTIDKHFQPQWMNVLHGFAPLDYLGHMEQMDSVADYLQQFGFALERSHVNTTNATEKVQRLIGDKAADLIRRYYADDFRLYGYSDDPGVLAPVRKADVLNSSREKLKRTLEHWQRAAAVA